MADMNINALAGQATAMAPPVRTDDLILPCIRWVPIGKSNCYLDLKKSQSNPIYKITVDLLKHTNFFRAFTASSTIPSIYIQQFWDTVQYAKKDGCYRCQLDEHGRIYPIHKYLYRGQTEFVSAYNREEEGHSDCDPKHPVHQVNYPSPSEEGYLAGETGSNSNSPALKPVKPARKPKSTVPKAPPRPSVSTPITSA
nr:hypothetical protein [Tanacetum cinerariifolium]